MTPPTAPKRGMGRPSRIDEVVAHDNNGAPITFAERVISLVQAGNYVDTAAASLGCDRDTLFDWMRQGHRARRKRQSGGRLTKKERRMLDFSVAIQEAQAAAELADVTLLARIGQGGIVTTVVTEKVDGEGVVLARTTRTETLPPNDSVIRWRLERRFGRKWSQRAALELSGVDGGPISLDTSAIVAKMQAARDAHADELDDEPLDLDDLDDESDEPDRGTPSG